MQKRVVAGLTRRPCSGADRRPRARGASCPLAAKASAAIVERPPSMQEGRPRTWARYSSRFSPRRPVLTMSTARMFRSDAGPARAPASRRRRWTSRELPTSSMIFTTAIAFSSWVGPVYRCRGGEPFYPLGGGRVPATSTRRRRPPGAPARCHAVMRSAPRTRARRGVGEELLDRGGDRGGLLGERAWPRSARSAGRRRPSLSVAAPRIARNRNLPREPRSRSSTPRRCSPPCPRRGDRALAARRSCATPAASGRCRRRSTSTRRRTATSGRCRPAAAAWRCSSG